QVLGRIQCTTSCYRSCVLFFLQRTCPIHFFRPKTKFLGGFTRFCCREVQVVRSGFGVHKMQHYVLPKLRLVFSLRSCPIHFFRPKTMFLGGFARFRCREVHVVISGFGVHKMHHFVLPKLRLVFLQRTRPIHFFRPKTKFLGGFARFHCREVPVVRSGFGVHKMHHFVHPKLLLVFSQRPCRIHFFRPKTKFLGGFARFRCREVPVVRLGFVVHKMHHFVISKFRLVFSQQTSRIHLFRPKTKFLGGFTRFRCREVPVVRSGFGVHTMHHFMLPKLRLVFRNEHTQSTCLGPKLSFWVVSCDSVAGRYKL